jgi:hypothetical protein
MSNHSPLSEEQERAILAEIGMTPERSKEIAEHVKTLFNGGDSWTSTNINMLAQTYTGTELVYASMGFHELLRKWEEEKIKEFVFGRPSPH